MLLGEQFGRRHQRDLAAGLDRGQRSGRGDDGLARTDIALHQAQHRHRFARSRSISAITRCCAPVSANGRFARSAGPHRAVAGQRGRDMPAHLRAQAFQAQVMGQQFLEREALLRRMRAQRQRGDIGLRGRAMHVEQRIAQRGQLQRRAHRGGDQFDRLGIGQTFERARDHAGQALLTEAFGGRIDRRQAVFGRGYGAREHAPVFRMHDFQAVRAMPDFAVTQEAGARRELFGLCSD